MLTVTLNPACFTNCSLCVCMTWVMWQICVMTWTWEQLCLVCSMRSNTSTGRTCTVERPLQRDRAVRSDGSQLHSFHCVTELIKVKLVLSWLVRRRWKLISVARQTAHEWHYIVINPAATLSTLRQTHAYLSTTGHPVPFGQYTVLSNCICVVL